MRKRIAVFMSELIAEYQESVLKTIFAQANSLGYDVFVFSGYGSYDNNVLYAEGEKNLIKIPDLSTFDGIIVADDTFDIYGMEQELAEIIKETATCPVVYLRSGNENFNSILFDDVETMKELTRYMIEERGFSDICFMSGPMDMADAAYRQQGFMEAMSEAGLFVYDKMIFEGDYWRHKGKEAVDYFMKDRDTYPQAIICSNDHMALSVINELTSRGIRVPEDVSVSGYDCTEDGKAFTPSLTSVQVSFKEMSVKAVQMIDDINSGKEVDKVVRIKCKPVYRKSTNPSYVSEPYDTAKLMNEVNSRYDLAKLIVDAKAAYANTFNEDEIFNVAQKFFYGNYALRGYICLCDFDKSGDDHGKIFTDDMILWAVMHQDKSIKSYRPKKLFSRKEILPADITDREEPSNYIVFPLHYLNKEYGYYVLEYDKDQWVNLFTGSFFMCLVDTFEDMEKKKELADMEELRRLYNEDPLTGLLNRRGFEMSLQLLYDQALEKDEYLSIVSIDMDRLKFINDTYGHAEGDEAIRKIADIMKGLIRGNEICARLGGDEFCIILYSDTRARHEQFENVFKKIIEAESDKWDKPYRLHASIGMYCIHDDKKLPLMACMKIADKRMYAAKTRYKKSLEKNGLL